METKKQSLIDRFVNSIYPPRVITVSVCFVYGLMIAIGVESLTQPPNPVFWFAAALLIVGGAVGACSAWVGAYWLEGPMAILVAVGVGLEVVVRVPFVVDTGHWFTVFLAAALCLMFVIRIQRIWPKIYPSDRDPRIQAAVKAVLAREEYERMSVEG